MTSSAAEFLDVSLCRGDVLALKNVSLTRPLGQSVLGGSGTSTLVQLIIGLLCPDSGTVRTLGARIDYDDPKAASQENRLRDSGCRAFSSSLAAWNGPWLSRTCAATTRIITLREPVSKFKIAAKLSLRDGLQGATSEMSLFHLSGEQRRKPLAMAIPIRYSTVWLMGISEIDFIDSLRGSAGNDSCDEHNRPGCRAGRLRPAGRDPKLFLTTHRIFHRRSLPISAAPADGLR